MPNVNIDLSHSGIEEKDLFYAKVSLQGYEYNDYYDEYVFERKDMIRYEVNEDFPKLIPGNLPKGIVKATYDIALLEISQFIKK